MLIASQSAFNESENQRFSNPICDIGWDNAKTGQLHEHTIVKPLTIFRNCVANDLQQVRFSRNASYIQCPLLIQKRTVFKS
jgi:hypothetical protein